ncbi:MAG: polyprenyl diphosphate synthase [Candidatus Paceibacterota bacterium]|jgi:tritrans,polycis-undecaprenyl-diphosphate synthase [geranylgeranyl-diphosphate specific]|nr:polyprenyl diphosphate synthase [Candidatus Paceibacterota bacterium]
MKNIPAHIALIPDGNRRWAKKRNLPAFVGHERGAEALEKILQKSLELKIPYFTFWGSSLDNITKRSKKEVGYLFQIFEKQFKRLAKDKRIHKNEVKISVLGRWKEYFPPSLNKAIEQAMEKTKGYKRYHLTFLMAYNGTDEMEECIKNIVKTKQKVNEKTIKQNLWTKDLPSVDLVIRTGCEDDPHLSAGFMMWDIAYAQLYFTRTYFPAFSPKEYEKAIKDYVKRERRKGA